MPRRPPSGRLELLLRADDEYGLPDRNGDPLPWDERDTEALFGVYPEAISMAVRKKGRSIVEVDGRRFSWYIHRDTHVRIASEDQRFVIAYRWYGKPELSIIGPGFPGVSRSEPRPLVMYPPAFAHRGPADLARQLIRWALSSNGHPASRAPSKID